MSATIESVKLSVASAVGLAKMDWRWR